MNKREYRIGPGAASLMLVIVVVAVSLMSLLALQRARNDRELTLGSFSHMHTERATVAEAERDLAGLDGILAVCAAESADDAEYLENIAALLPEGMIMDGRYVRWQVDAEGRSLVCAVEIMPLGTDTRFEWHEHAFVSGAADAAIQGENDGT